MSNFAMLRFGDQITVVLAVFIVVAAVVTMVVVGSESLKKWFSRRLTGLANRIQRFNDKYFSDDEPFEEWMDREAWEKTRL